MPLVSIDCRFAAQHAGLGRYTRAIVQHLLSLDTALQYALLVGEGAQPWLDTLPAGGWTTVFAPERHYTLAEQLRLPAHIAASGADLHFAPHFLVPLRCPVPFVATIHDLILHRYPNRRGVVARVAYRSVLRHTVRSARHLLVPSTFVRDDLAAVYGALPPSTVTGEGVDPLFSPALPSAVDALRARLQIDRPYFLYVGNAKEHKNVPLLLSAFAAAKRSDALLLLRSGGHEADRLVLPPNVRLLPAVDDCELPALYTGAMALVTASSYEGFCLPVAEALACGCPVIAANTSAIPQTACGHAQLLPLEEQAFTDAFRSTPARPAPQHLWSWETAARATAAALLQAMS